MTLSKYQLQEVKKLKIKAFKLYKQGLTTRQVGELINRSHAWVALAIKELKN